MNRLQVTINIKFRPKKEGDVTMKDLDNFYEDKTFPPECPDEELEKFSTVHFKDLDLTEFDHENNYIDIELNFRHKAMDTKKSYIIDGVLLIPEGSELPEKMPTIDKFLKE
mmetsp:Transcript_1143/g.1033  ORF Transcript_1143/g.1033 Transcript_1143/m.1033 type:complete len:111 (-) Transcript_1143:22-354(-)